MMEETPLRFDTCGPEPESNNRRSQRGKILNMLSCGGFVRSRDLAAVGLQYNARIKELREGIHDDNRYIISAEVRDGVYGFVMLGMLSGGEANRPRPWTRC